MMDRSQFNHTRRGFLGRSVVLGAGFIMGTPRRSLAALDGGGRRRAAAPATTAIADGLSPVEDIAGTVALSMSAVVRDGLSDVLPRPFEVDLLASSPHLQLAVFDQVVARLEYRRFDVSHFKPIEYVFLPKRLSTTLRRCAVIDPVDLISYLALSILAAPRIEAGRPPRAEKSVFSFRFSGRSPHLFNQKYSYATFVRHIDQRRDAPATKILVTADIERFYDRLNLDLVGASLLRCSVERWVVDYLIDLLAYWSLGSGRGLPVGSNASRILAEAVLAGIDDELRAAHVDYARFVDDFRFFAPDTSTARTWLKQLGCSLDARGLALNSEKTRFIDAAASTTSSGLGVRSRLPRILVQDTSPGERSDSATEKDKPTPDENDDNLHPDSWKRRRKFRQPRSGEQERLRDLDLVRVRADVMCAPGGSSAALYDFVAGSIYQRDFAAVREIPDLLSVHLHGTAYAVGALVSTAELLPDQVRRHIAARFAAILLDENLPTHAAMEIVDLLSSEGYRSPPALLAYLSSLGSRTGCYLGRVALDGLRRCEASLDRRTVARMYGRLNAWGQRAVLTPTLAGSTVIAMPSVVRSARRSAETDLFMKALVTRLDRNRMA